MNIDQDVLLQIITILLGSSILATIFAGHFKRETEKRKIVAEATKSALSRVEMYYRVRRRFENKEDETSIRDKFHSIQEENDYYKSLLLAESQWFGVCYAKFLQCVKDATNKKINQAWQKAGEGPGAVLDGDDHIIIANLTNKFAKDSKKYTTTRWRVLKHIWHVWLKREVKGYNVE